MKKVLVTTPIYYVNGKPHIWHTYSSLIADVLARSLRSLKYDVKFSTWVDENSQKTVQKAKELNKDVYEYLDEMAQIHKSTWDKYKISYTDFVRTSSEKHKRVVQDILKKTYDKGYIYKSKYKGLYCVGCEAFKKEDDLVEKDWKLVCPDHLKPCEYIEEENYFFELTAFENFLKNLYKNNPKFVFPENRFNEVKSFVNEWLEDFSISRQKVSFWIPFPFDEDQVVYVWYDALFNYWTVNLDDNLNDLGYFENVYHVIWKDIAKFHAIYWPAMLKAVNLPTPKSIFTTWFFTVDGQKMSKSLWNVVEPLELLEKYWRDAVVLYLFYDIKIWKDWDFSFSRFEDVYKNILVWWWWNLVYRISKLADKYKVSDDIQINWEDELKEIKNHVFIKGILDKSITKIIEDFILNVDYQTYLKHWYELVQLVNKYIQDTQPWVVYKTDENKAKTILKNAIWLIQKINLLSSFFFIEWFEKINQIFGFEQIDNSKNFTDFENLIYQEKIAINNISPEIVYKKL